MNLTKTFGGMIVSATPAPLPGVTFVFDGPPGEYLDMRQVRELYELLGDVLGEARCTIGVSENDVLARWQLRHENAEEESGELVNFEQLPREVAAMILYDATKHYSFDFDAINELIDEALDNYADDDAVVNVGEPSLAGGA